MYKIGTEMEFAGAHKLKLSYKSKCQGVHGHNWKCYITLESNKLNKNGMIIDFSALKEMVNTFDHKNINDIVSQPTAENIAFTIYNLAKQLVPIQLHAKIVVRIYETEKNWAEYTE